MNLLFGHDDTVAAWVAERAKGKPFNHPFTTIGFLDGSGALRGGFVFTGYNGDAVQVSGAGSAIAHRSAWQALISYAFDQLKCSRVEMNTRKSNKRTKRILAPTRSGFTFEGIARKLYGREDGVRFSLTVDDLDRFKKKWKLI